MSAGEIKDPAEPSQDQGADRCSSRGIGEDSGSGSHRNCTGSGNAF